MIKKAVKKKTSHVKKVELDEEGKEELKKLFVRKRQKEIDNLIKKGKEIEKEVGLKPKSF